MKVYYIANARFPTERAHGVQMAKMIEALLQAGTDVTLVVPNRKTKSQSARDFYGLTRDIPTIRLPAIDIYKHGKIGFIIGSLTFMLSYLLFLLAKKISGETFVAYTIDMDQFSTIFVPLSGVRYFVEIHDSKNYGFIYNVLFKRTQGIITINNLIKANLVKNFALLEEKIIVHPNGIDLNFFKPRAINQEFKKKNGIQTDKKIVLYTGKFYEWKGLEVLVHAGALISKNAMLCIVGGTKEELQKITGLTIPDTVICTGQKDYKEMPEWNAIADALIVLGTKHNDYSYYYTSPMKLFEYMAMEKPIIAADTPAIRQIVTENEVTFYSPDDAEDLAKKISFVFENGDRVKAKTMHAEQAVKKFSWYERAQSVISFIQNRQQSVISFIQNRQ
ncbi:glycosyltransferase [Candidatus Parcubacteria bacterium]|nr:glycosyltransferase [Candidatus Parcubacteria bacterium]